MSTGRAYTGNLARGGYELIFLVFMLGVAYLMRGNPSVVYPHILHLFAMLMAGNLLFNIIVPRLRGGEVWVVELALLLNMALTTEIIRYSGAGDSYFWVLYLLPIFTAALAVKLFDVVSSLAFCSLAVVYFSKPLPGWDLAEGFGVGVKLAIFLFSAAVLYRTARSKLEAERVLEEKRAEAARLARELEEEKGALVADSSAAEVGRQISGVLHDLGNPLAVILLGAEVLSSSETNDKATADRMVRAARYAKAMLASVMGIVRGREYVFEPDDFSEAVRSALLLADYPARKKGVVLRTEIQEPLPPAVISRVHIQRALNNLLSNAISYAPEGSAVSLRAICESGIIRGEVADCGPGFPEEIVRGGIRAFRTTRRGAGGTGLGLFVAEEIVRRHGGRLSIGNSPRGGGSVMFEIPISGPAGTPPAVPG